MKDLLNQGFNEKTLTELRGICFSKMDEAPTVYYVLDSIFLDIEEAFENQAMPIAIYEKYESLIPYIIDLVSKKDIANIDKLLIAFNQIKQSFKS
jgi:hypothetical protein